MVKKSYFLFSIVFIVSGGACVFGQTKDPNAAEVLGHYKDSLSWVESVSMLVDMKIEGSIDGEETPLTERHFIFRRDCSRAEWLGELLELDDKGAVDFTKSHVIKTIMTGDSYVNLSGLLKAPPLGAMITDDCEYYKETQERLFDSPIHGGALWGKMYGGSHKDIAELLGQSDNLTLRDNPQNINGVPCYVLEGTTEHGKVTAWIAPEKGYNALKWSINKTSGDLFDDRPLSLNSWLAVFDAVELQKVGDVFVTKVGRLTFTIDYDDGHTKSISCYKYKVDDIQLEPDFESLAAFRIDLPDGTPVHIKEYPGIRYVWQNGKIVPADDPTFEEIDKMVEELKKEKEADN